MKIILPIVSFLNITNWLSSWSISKVLFGINENNLSIERQNTDNILKIFYPKDSYSPSKYPVGGLGFFSSPKEIFMSEHIILSYQFKFADNFNPMLGGKLPGLFLSRDPSETKGSSGGQKNDNTASIRLAWRSEFKGEVYVYLPNTQNKDYSTIPGFRSNGKFGDSLWKNIIQFDNYNWNNITLEIKLNTIQNNIPEENGVLTVVVNNQTLHFDKIVYRIKKEVFISAFLFDTFFGGSNERYATPVDTYTFFKNIQLEKLD